MTKFHAWNACTHAVYMDMSVKIMGFSTSLALRYTIWVCASGYCAQVPLQQSDFRPPTIGAGRPHQTHDDVRRERDFYDVHMLLCVVCGWGCLYSWDNNKHLHPIFLTIFKSIQSSVESLSAANITQPFHVLCKVLYCRESVRVEGILMFPNWSACFVYHHVKPWRI